MRFWKPPLRIPSKINYSRFSSNRNVPQILDEWICWAINNNQLFFWMSRKETLKATNTILNNQLLRKCQTKVGKHLQPQSMDSFLGRHIDFLSYHHLEVAGQPAESPISLFTKLSCWGFILSTRIWEWYWSWPSISSKTVNNTPNFQAG